MEATAQISEKNEWLQQLRALLDPPQSQVVQLPLQSSWSGISLISAPATTSPMLSTTTAATAMTTPLPSSSMLPPASSKGRAHQKQDNCPRLCSVSKKRQTRATTLKNVKTRSRSRCKSTIGPKTTVATPSVKSAILTTTPPLQASASTSTTTSQAPASAASTATLTSPTIPIAIDSLDYVATVFDSIFAPLIDGTSLLHQNIRQVLIRKLLLDHASQELLTRHIITFNDLQTFVLDVLRHTTLVA